MTYLFYDRYPKIEVDGRTITDITKRIIMFELSKNNIVAYEKYWVSEGEKPEHVAFKYYGDVGYHWIVLLANDIINPYYDWPMSDKELKTYIDRKYGVNQANQIHHYVASEYSTDLPPGTIVDEYYATKTPVTNFEYETEMNDRLREIKLIKPVFALEIVNQFEELIKK